MRGDVLADRAFGLELPDALQHRRWRQSHGFGDVGLGRPGVFLKNLQNLSGRFRRLFCLTAAIL